MENKEEQALRGDKPTPEEQAHLDECRREEMKLLEMKGGAK